MTEQSDLEHKMETFRDALARFRHEWLLYRAGRHLTKAAKLYIAAGELPLAQGIVDFRHQTGA